MKRRDTSKMDLATFDDCVARMDAIGPTSVGQLLSYSETLEALCLAASQTPEGLSVEDAVAVHPFYLLGWWFLLVRRTEDEAKAGAPVERGRFERMGKLMLALARKLADSEARDLVWGAMRDEIFLDLADRGIWPAIERLARHEMESPVCREGSIANWSGLDNRAHVGMWLAVALARQCRFDEALETAASLVGGGRPPEGVIASAIAVLELAGSPALQLLATVQEASDRFVYSDDDAAAGVIYYLKGCNADALIPRSIRDIAGPRGHDHDELPSAWLHELVSMVPRLAAMVDAATADSLAAEDGELSTLGDALYGSFQDDGLGEPAAVAIGQQTTLRPAVGIGEEPNANRPDSPAVWRPRGTG